MVNILNIEVAEIPIAVEFSGNWPMEQIKRDYAPFITDKTAGIHIDADIVPSLLLEDPQCNFHCQDNLVVADEEFRGYLDPSRGIGRLETLSTKPIRYLAVFLRNLFSFLIVRGGGFVLHACGVIKDGKGYVFIGSSGSGKTTVARSSPNSIILSDDLVFIRPLIPDSASDFARGDYRMFSTPKWGDWKGNDGINRPFPVNGLFVLVKDRELYLKKISYAKGTSMILTIPGLYNSDRFGESALDRWIDLVMGIPCYELHFPLDGDIWRCIEHYE